MTLLLCPLQMTFVPIHEFYLLYKGCVRGLFLAIYLNSKWQVLPLTKFIYYFYYLVGSTYLFILPVHDSDQFFPSVVYYLLKGGRWLRSPPPKQKKKLQFVITQTFVLSSIIYVYILERIIVNISKQVYSIVEIFHRHPLLKNKRI